MLRLMGLPAARRFPDARISRDGTRLRLVFAGPGGELTREVDLTLAGPDEDPETLELRLLARLQDLGYRVTRAEPPLTG